MTGSSRRLLLLRHAESDRLDGIRDHDRPLSPHGVEEACSVGSYLAQENLLPDLAVISGATRTRATWDCVQKMLPKVVSAIFDERIYEAHPSVVLDVIRAASAQHNTVLLVGHNPGVHSVALQLIGRAAQNTLGRLRHEYPPASLCVIDFDVANWSDIADHSGVLERFATPATSFTP